MNIVSPYSFFFTVIILLFLSASIKRSRIIDLMGEKLLQYNDSRTALMSLIASAYITGPLFLPLVLVKSFDRLVMRFEKKNRIYTLLTVSALMGSIILPFGNMRNVFISIAIGGGKPSLTIAEFAGIMLPLWISGLVVIIGYAFFTVKDIKIKTVIHETKWKWKELLFCAVLLIFIIAYFNGKMNLIGFLILTGAFSFAFISLDTLKEVDWWLLIPAAFSFLFYYLLRNHVPVLKPLQGYISGIITSGILSSNIASYMIPYSGINNQAMLYSISVGSIVSIIASVESIWILRKSNHSINWKILLQIFAILLVTSTIILFITGGFYG